MGKGDIKTKRGKIIKGTFGNPRRRKKKTGFKAKGEDQIEPRAEKAAKETKGKQESGTKVKKAPEAKSKEEKTTKKETKEKKES